MLHVLLGLGRNYTLGALGPLKTWMDLCRLLLALVVVVDHLAILYLFPSLENEALWFPYINVAAATAVGLFFVLSGYAIAHSIGGNRARFGRVVLRDYLARRIARIYPPLIVALGLGSLVYFLAVQSGIADLGLAFGQPGAQDGTVDVLTGTSFYIAQGSSGGLWPQLVKELTMTHNIWLARDDWHMVAASWTLSFEGLFYVVAGISARLFDQRHPLASFFAASVLSALVLYALYSENHFLRIFCVLWGFGYLCGWLKLRASWMAGLVTLAAASLLLFYSLSVSMTRGWDIALSPYADNWALLLTLVAGGWLVVLAVGLVIRLMAKLSKSQGQLSVPEFSYSLYITHFPLLLLADFYISPLLAAVGLWPSLFTLVVACIAAAWLIALVAERKGLFASLILALLPKPDLGRRPQTAGDQDTAKGDEEQLDPGETAGVQPPAQQGADAAAHHD